MQYCCIDPSLIISCSCFIASMKMQNMNQWMIKVLLGITL
jgi:hypothetical protein